MRKVYRTAAKGEPPDVGRIKECQQGLLQEVLRCANLIRGQRYSKAAAVFAAGSFIRGEFTSHSDIDLVVVFDRLPHAYRESFLAEGFPVEAFIHDSETLRYFMIEADCASGVPSLPQMVKEGVEIPGPNRLTRTLKELAESLLAAGPPELSEEERRGKRYGITDLVDDLREPRSVEELVATGARLYEALSDYYLRANGFWSATGKSIPRVLKKTSPALFERFGSSFGDLFRGANPGPVIGLAEEILKPDGGFLFDGYRSDAPPDWRK